MGKDLINKSSVEEIKYEKCLENVLIYFVSRNW